MFRRGGPGLGLWYRFKPTTGTKRPLVPVWGWNRYERSPNRPRNLFWRQTFGTGSSLQPVPKGLWYRFGVGTGTKGPFLPPNRPRGRRGPLFDLIVTLHSPQEDAATAEEKRAAALSR